MVIQEFYSICINSSKLLKTPTGSILIYKMRELDQKSLILLNHIVKTNFTLKFLFYYTWTHLLGLNSFWATRLSYKPLAQFYIIYHNGTCDQPLSFLDWEFIPIWGLLVITFKLFPTSFYILFHVSTVPIICFGISQFLLALIYTYRCMCKRTHKHTHTPQTE